MMLSGQKSDINQNGNRGGTQDGQSLGQGQDVEQHNEGNHPDNTHVAQQIPIGEPKHHATTKRVAVGVRKLIRKPKPRCGNSKGRKPDTGITSMILRCAVEQASH